MNALFEAAKEVCDFMKSRHWKFCVIGGLAVQRWGELRTTLDANLIAIRQKLDSGYILRHLKPLCELKETPELVEQALRILEKHPWRK